MHFYADFLPLAVEAKNSRGQKAVAFCLLDESFCIRDFLYYFEDLEGVFSLEGVFCIIFEDLEGVFSLEGGFLYY